MLRYKGTILRFLKINRINTEKNIKIPTDK